MRCIVVILALGITWPALAAEGIQAGGELALPAAGPQGTPAVAFGQGTYLAAWREGWHGKGGRARIHVMRLSPEGKPLDAAPIELPAPAGVQERPRVAFGGGCFLVVWQGLREGKDYDVLAARVGVDGKAIDQQAIVIAGGPRNQALPDVASDGKAFLVVWQGLRGDETEYRGIAAAVGADGRVGPAVETGLTPQPKVAWNGSSYLAIAGENGTFAGNVRAALMSADGKVEGKPAPVIRGTKAAAFCVSGVPGKGWLVVSHRSGPDPWGWGGPGAMRGALVDMQARPVNTDGVKEPAGVQQRLPGWLDFGREKKAGSTWPWGQSASAFDGAHTVVVWPRHHLCGEKMTNFENSDLIAARVDGFSSLDPAGIPVAATPAEERNPALASDGAGGLLLLYEKHESEGAGRIVGRVLRTR